MSEMVYLLRSIGGWRVGCENHLEKAALVQLAINVGYVGTRLHYAPQHPDEGDLAFEVTDSGIEKVREMAVEYVAEEISNMRKWYRDNTSRPLAG